MAVVVAEVKVGADLLDVDDAPNPRGLVAMARDSVLGPCTRRVSRLRLDAKAAGARCCMRPGTGVCAVRKRGLLDVKTRISRNEKVWSAPCTIRTYDISQEIG